MSQQIESKIGSDLLKIAQDEVLNDSQIILLKKIEEEETKNELISRELELMRKENIAMKDKIEVLCEKDKHKQTLKLESTVKTILDGMKENFNIDESMNKEIEKNSSNFVELCKKKDPEELQLLNPFLKIISMASASCNEKIRQLQQNNKNGSGRSTSVLTPIKVDSEDVSKKKAKEAELLKTLRERMRKKTHEEAFAVVDNSPQKVNVERETKKLKQDLGIKTAFKFKDNINAENFLEKRITEDFQFHSSFFGGKEDELLKDIYTKLN